MSNKWLILNVLFITMLSSCKSASGGLKGQTTTPFMRGSFQKEASRVLCRGNFDDLVAVGHVLERKHIRSWISGSVLFEISVLESDFDDAREAMRQSKVLTTHRFLLPEESRH